MNQLEQIEKLTIGPATASLSFSKRLARENGWSAPYAQRVFKEYQRFIYMAANSKRQLTPSDQVDQAWNLHLTYSRSYWFDLCRDTLGFDLHHLPTEGGPAEQARFRKQYQQTLDLYQQTFGEPAPEDIWPCIAERFDASDQFVRLNRAHTWLIKRPRVTNAKIVLAATLPLFLVACSETLADRDLWFWIKAIFGGWVIYKVVVWLGRYSNGGGGGCGSSGGDGGCGSGDSGCGGGGD
jgi:hypothetical protein